MTCLRDWVVKWVWICRKSELNRGDVGTRRGTGEKVLGWAWQRAGEAGPGGGFFEGVWIGVSVGEPCGSTTGTPSPLERGRRGRLFFWV